MTLAEQTQLVFEEQVIIPARDGTPLVASITRPAGEGPFPAVLTRTPYDRMNQGPVGQQWAAAGYAFVRQDVRGRYDSEGEFYPYRDDPSDGEATLEWIAQQPWCSGAVGMTGASHVGTVQYLVAPRQPAALTAAIPEFAPASVYHYWWRHGGAFRMSFNVSWAILLSRDNARHYPGRLAKFTERQQQVWVTPDEMRALQIKPLYREWSPEQFADLDDCFGNNWFSEFMRQQSYGPFWEPYDFTTQHQDFATPMLHIGGWHDTFQQGTIDSYTSLVKAGGADQRLIMGPWRHVNWGMSDVGELDFAPGVFEVDPFATRRAWFDRWLNGGPVDGPPVLIFVMGENAWRGEEAWPPPAMREESWYLGGDGGAGGTLSRDEPSGDQAPLVYDFNPRDPVITLGGPEWVNYPCGPFDQKPLDGRSDVLTFRSAPLEQDLEVTGQVRVRLHVTSSAVDTDFTAKLVDVHPDGRAYNLCDGIIRARYRDSLSQPSMLTPGEPAAVEIDLWSTSNLFRRGHRIRLDISSSNFPRFDVNSNTGDDSTGGPDTKRDVVVARNGVLIGREYPSQLVLPVVPR